MEHEELLALLQRIREQRVRDEDLVAARGLVAELTLDGIDPDALFREEPTEDAEALLGMLGHGPSLFGATLAAAVVDEAGAVHRDDAPPAAWIGDVMRSLFDLDGAADDELAGWGPTHDEEASPPVAEAVAREAGRAPDVATEHDDGAVPVAAAVSDEAGLGPDVARSHDADAVPVSAAVAFEAGESPDVASEHDAGSVPVAEAVRAEAGQPPDVASAHDAGAIPIQLALLAEAGRVPEVASSFDAGRVPVAEAVAREAGRVEVADAVVAELFFAADDGVARAVAAEAGEVDVVSDVLRTLGIAQGVPAPVVEDRPQVEATELPEAWVSALLDHELEDALHLSAARRIAVDDVAAAELTSFAEVGRELREGVMSGAGAAPSLWSDVAHAIGIADPERVEGWDETLLAQALPAEAGTVSVVDAVMELIDATDRSLAPEVPDIPMPANDVSWSALVGALAAAVLLLVYAPRMFTEEPSDEFVPVATEFASAGEVHLDELDVVNQEIRTFVDSPEGQDGPLIIYIDAGEQ